MPFERLKKILGSTLGRIAGGQQDSKPVIRTRAPRIKLTAEHHISLELYDRLQRGRTTPFTLANISVSGLAFMSPDFDFSTSVGGVLRGVFRLGEQSSAVELQVVHHTRGLVGARWISMDPIFKKSLFDFLGPEQAATESVRTPQDQLQPEPDGTPLHYRGLSGNEYFAVHHEGRVVRQQVTIFGIRIGRVTGERLEFAARNKKIGEAQTGAAGEDLVLFPMMPDDQQKVLAQAVRFIRALPGLEPELQESATRALGF
jgi:hypothetical protein